MKSKSCLLLLTFMFFFVANAQELQVCDATTKLPIRDVQVKIDGRDFGKTDYRGIILLPDTFKTAAFISKNYQRETFYHDEIVSDSLFLFDKKHCLDEVVVMGKHRINGRELLKKLPRRDILDPEPQHILGEFDLGLMLDRRLKRDKKHVGRLRKIFKKMDGTDENDPILRVYNQIKVDKQKQKIEQQIRENREK